MQIRMAGQTEVLLSVEKVMLEKRGEIARNMQCYEKVCLILGDRQE
jgi:hypothetical protein